MGSLKRLSGPMEGDYDRAVELYHPSWRSIHRRSASSWLGTINSGAAVEDASGGARDDRARSGVWAILTTDIGAYLIELGRLKKAITWLDALRKPAAYEPRPFLITQPGSRLSGKETVQPSIRCFHGKRWRSSRAIHTGARRAAFCFAAWSTENVSFSWTVKLELTTDFKIHSLHPAASCPRC